jgi:large subunit ribosomal protein L25
LTLILIGIELNGRIEEIPQVNSVMLKGVICMEETILKATVRTESPKKARQAGFTPGVLNEHDTTSTSVQFETPVLNKVISKHGPNAKIWVEMGKKKRFGFIKEVQRHPVEGKVIHIAVQLMKENQEVKMHLPIAFHGRDELEHRLLQVHIYKADMEVVAKAALMPDVVVTDVSKKQAGDTVSLADFKLPAGLRVLDGEHEIYAVVKVAKEIHAEEPAEVKTEAKVEEKAEAKAE